MGDGRFPLGKSFGSPLRWLQCFHSSDCHQAGPHPCWTLGLAVRGIVKLDLAWQSLAVVSLWNLCLLRCCRWLTPLCLHCPSELSKRRIDSWQEKIFISNCKWSQNMCLTHFLRVLCWASPQLLRAASASLWPHLETARRILAAIFWNLDGYWVAGSLDFFGPFQKELVHHEKWQ